jgi:isoquinoline 1-oxidoreductase
MHEEQFMEPERYEWEEGPRYTFALNRREWFVFTSAGLLVTRALGQSPAQGVASRILVGADGRIRVLTGKVEVGQGSRAQITQAAAEELRVSPGRVDLVMADTGVCPDDGATAGSRTTPSTVPAVRKASAAAREILISLARAHWKVEQVEAKDATVLDAKGGRSLTYAQLAALPGAAGAFRNLPSAQLTPAKEWSVLGRTLLRPNGRDIVTGSHAYPSDIKLPGMVYGKVLRPPSFGATLESLDQTAAGAQLVREGDFAGCVAGNSFAAKEAVDALGKTAKWKQRTQVSSANLYQHLKESSGKPGLRAPRVDSRGSVEQAMTGASKTLKASYQVAYIQHAPMEPRAAVAEWKDGHLTVWTGTQRPEGVRNELASAFRIPAPQVRVVVPDTGGGFGGKHTGECAIEAARLAKAAGKPVSLRWTREEEFTWAYFRPAGLIEIVAALDAEGRVSAWDYTNYNSGTSALASPYAIPNRKEQFRYSESPLREGSYRALASTANNFARECFMDELATAASKDPLAFRLANLEHPRLRGVLEAAASRFKWEQRKGNRQPRRGVGLACGTEKGSFVAACAEVEVQQGRIRVLEICQAFDCGAIMNPTNLKSQVEGCIVMTLGATLQEEIQFENGKILNGRFSKYPVPRFRDVPKLDTVLLDRPDLDWAGAGETPMIAAPPAVANAVFDAIGVRLRSMPLRLAGNQRA